MRLNNRFSLMKMCAFMKLRLLWLMLILGFFSACYIFNKELQMVFGRFLCPCSDFHCRVITILMQCHLRAWRSQSYSTDFSPRLLCTKISSDSLNFLTILWTVDDEIPTFFAILHRETLFQLLNYLLTQSLRLLLTSEKPGQPAMSFSTQWCYKPVAN